MAQVRAHLKVAEQNAEFMKGPPHARTRADDDKAREEKTDERRVTRGRRVKVRKTRRGQWAGKDHARKEREEARRANKEKRAAEETAHEMEMNAIAYRLCERMLEDVKKSMNAIVYRL